MASFSSSILMPPASFTSKTLELGYASSSSLSCRCSLILTPLFIPQRKQMMFHKNRSKLKQRVLSMAPEEEKLTRRNPLDFPIEWNRPKPGRRPDIFPQFSPMKTPLPPPLPYDPPDEDEEEEEKKEEEEEEEEEDPEKEESDNPEKQ
ncbi:uncharacterized protein LOC100268077 [Vitis vinifera]|uniref:Uncharacterized protein n=2 Tax=Vitis vinifera TaxID=29760 RepID=A0A438EIU3_VITVI|nr:uncharacterized protein LOC100268077 [Vitis vinifera]RVW47545.1 hypothetical protein CK203_073761 [Vitis vinifera]|eukprot:XP_002284517.1 PREDICTED: histone acetyltransferase KAT6B [Vitis vinifera]